MYAITRHKGRSYEPLEYAEYQIEDVDTLFVAQKAGEWWIVWRVSKDKSQPWVNLASFGPESKDPKDAADKAAFAAARKHVLALKAA